MPILIQISLFDMFVEFCGIGTELKIGSNEVEWIFRAFGLVLSCSIVERGREKPMSTSLFEMFMKKSSI